MKGVIVIKKTILIISLIIVFSLLAAAAYIYYVPDPLNTVNEYIMAWQVREYQNIEDLLTEESQGQISVDEIQASYDNFLNQAGIEMIDVIDVSKFDGDFFHTEFKLRVRIESRYFDDQEVDYYIHLEREGLIKWKMVWNYQMIYPGIRSGDTFIRERSLAQRGEIFDSKERPLAVKGDVITVGVHPNRIENREDLVSKLSELLSLDADYVDGEIDRYSNNPDWLVPIKKLTEADYRLLEGELRQIPGVVFSRSSGRIYPFAEIVAHTIGYMGEVDQSWIDSYPERDYRIGDRRGQTGLERAFEFELRGEPGYTLYLSRDISSDDQEISNDDTKDQNISNIIVMNCPSVHGDDIYLTLDMDYQQQVYRALGDSVGSIVLIDPNSGELLALANFPSYNSNDFALGMTRGEWEEIRTDERNPMLNRAIQGLYPPGSILKLLTASAALDTGLLEYDTAFSDTGEYRVQGNVISNFQKEVFGDHIFAEAIINSINTTMAKVGVELGEEEFRRYGEKFLLNGVRDFPLSVKESSLGSLRTPIDLAWSAVGQAEVVATPLQMAVFTSIIASGGRNVPASIVARRVNYQGDGSVIQITNSDGIVKQDEDSAQDDTGDMQDSINSDMMDDSVNSKDINNEENSRNSVDSKDSNDSSGASVNDGSNRVIKKETAEIVTRLMVGVVDEGTGKKAAIPGIKIAGKTGTAETGSGDGMTHAWFASFAPAESPELALLIFLEKGGVGGQDAAPIAGRLWREFLSEHIKSLESIETGT